MLLKNYCISTVILVALNFSVSAQAPGYMGKTFSAGYGINLSPALIGATVNDNWLNTIHEIFIDKALDDRWTMGAALRLYRTAYDNKIPVRFNNDLVNPNDRYFINGTTIALNFKHYRRMSVAPWGKYFMMSPVLNIARTSYDPYMHIRGTTGSGPSLRDTLYTDFGEPVQKFYHIDLMMGWGRTRVIADRVTIDYGINFQLVSLLGLITDYIKSENGLFYQDNYIRETHGIRIHGVNRFNLFMKLGYLF